MDRQLSSNITVVIWLFVHLDSARRSVRYLGDKATSLDLLIFLGASLSLRIAGAEQSGYVSVKRTYWSPKLQGRSALRAWLGTLTETQTRARAHAHARAHTHTPTVYANLYLHLYIPARNSGELFILLWWLFPSSARFWQLQDQFAQPSISSTTPVTPHTRVVCPQTQSASHTKRHFTCCCDYVCRSRNRRLNGTFLGWWC